MCIPETVIAQSPQTEPSVDNLPTGELVRQALEETKELVRLEIKLARDEVRHDALQLKRAAILFGVASALGVVALAMLDVAVVIALGATVEAALLVALIVVVEVLVVGFIGYRLLPKVPLERTRARLSQDFQSLKEHVT